MSKILVNRILGRLAEQFVDLCLDGISFRTPEPAVPIFHGSPITIDDTLGRIVDPLQGLAGYITGLFQRKAAHFMQQLGQFGMVACRNMAFYEDLYGHAIFPYRYTKFFTIARCRQSRARLDFYQETKIINSDPGEQQKTL